MRCLVTGGSGYVGSRLVERLAALEQVERVAVADMRRPAALADGVDLRPLDVRDPEGVLSLVQHERPDVLVHLAFVADPADPDMDRVNVAGTSAVLDAATEVGVGHVVFVSSVTAYGAGEGDDIASQPLTVRGTAGFEFARTKAVADRLCQLWAGRHPDRAMTIVRPCAVLGPNADNHVVRLFTENSQRMLAAGDRSRPLQFVHEDDLVAALVALVTAQRGGEFDVAGADTVSLGECADLIGAQRPRGLGAARRLGSLVRGSDPGLEDPRLVAFAPLVSCAALSEAVAWSPAHSSRDAFAAAMAAHGALVRRAA